MQQTVVHEHWSSRFVFLMAAIGCAVGLGNIWRFPFVAGENGGGAFVLIYLLCVMVVALPILIAEIMIGRMGGESPVNTMRKVAAANGRTTQWLWIGLAGMVVAFLILTFYSVIGGWALKYVQFALFAAFEGIEADAAGAMFEGLIGDPVQLTVWHTLFMALNVVIVANGLHKGIEAAVTVLMPMLFILLVFMVVYGLGTPGYAQAQAFLLNADFSKVHGETFLIAIGQAFFSVGVALGAMMTYGAYLNREVSITRSSLVIVVADTLVAVLAGIAIFPLVFSFGLEPASGPGLIFVTLPIAFGQMDIGHAFGSLFFVLLAAAALTSSISLLEPVVAWCEERFGMKRKVSASLVGGLAWLIGLGSVFSFNIWADFYPTAPLGILADKTVFDLLDYLTANVMMPLAGFFIALFAGWALSKDAILEGLGVHDALWFTFWRFSLRFVAPIALLGVFYANVGG